MRITIFLMLLCILSCKNKKETSGVLEDQKEYENVLPPIDPTEKRFNVFQCAGEDQANWQFIGPQKYNDSRGQWHGFVWNILGDERNYPDNMTLHTMVGTAGSGLWRFEKDQNGDLEWKCKTDPLNLQGLRINDIVRDPCNPDHILAATGTWEENSTTYGSGILSSIDNGSTWQLQDMRIASLTPDDVVYRIIFDKFTNCASRHSPYYVFTRRSKKWHFGKVKNGKYEKLRLPQIDDHHTFKDIEQIAKGTFLISNRNKFGLKASLYKTKNDGRSWANITHDLPEFPMNDKKKEGCTKCTPAKGCFCRPKTLSISTELEGKVDLYLSNQMFYGSNDLGETWQRHDITGLSRVDNNKIDIKRSPYSGLLYFGGVQPWVFDGEKKAPYIQGHDDVRDYHFLGYDIQTKEEYILLANDGGVSLVTMNTETLKASWEDVCGRSFPISQIWGLGVAQSIEENFVIGVMHNNSFYFDGKEWEKIGGGDGGSCLIDPMDKQYYFATGNPTLTKYGGPKRERIYSNNKWFLSSPVELHPANANKIYMGRNMDRGKDCGNKSFAKLVIYDDEAGKTVSKPITHCKFISMNAIGLSLSNPDLIIVGNGEKYGSQPGKVLKSEDGGDTWEDLSESQVLLAGGNYELLREVLAWQKVNDIAINPLDEREIYIAISNHHEKDGKRVNGVKRVLRSTNGGRSWKDHSTGLPSVSANKFLFQYRSNERIFLGTDIGVYYREKGMRNWQCYNNGLENLQVTDLEINYCRNELVIGTYGRGLWKTSLDLPEMRRSIDIDRNEVWDADRVIYSDVKVKKNKTLTLNGTIMMTPDVHFYLEQGANVNVNGELSCLCDEDAKCGEMIYLD